MHKELWKFLSVYQGLEEHENNGAPELPEYVIPNSTLDDMIREIFAVDPVSGLPKGDIQYYMSSEGNPQVKQWLENNLLKPRVVSGRSTPEGVTDDMIVEMSRRADESISDYSQRLMAIYRDCQSVIDSSSQNVELKSD